MKHITRDQVVLMLDSWLDQERTWLRSNNVDPELPWEQLMLQYGHAISVPADVILHHSRMTVLQEFKTHFLSLKW